MKEKAVKKYTVLKELEFPKGTAYKVGSLIELNDSQVKKFGKGLLSEVSKQENEIENIPTKDKDTTDENVVEDEGSYPLNDGIVNEITYEGADSIDENSYGVYKNGYLLRVYTRVNHGDDFQKIAEDFAGRSGPGVEARPITFTPSDAKETNSVEIVTVNGQPIRTFSLRVHGKDYLELANTLVKKYESKGYRIKE